jgi:hypothetical protein
MAYFIFLKYLDNLEDVRKNPHVKFLPKSPCAIFQTSAKFLKSIEIRKEFLFKLGPFPVFDPAAALPSPPLLMFGPCSVVFLPGHLSLPLSHVRARRLRSRNARSTYSSSLPTTTPADSLLKWPPSFHYGTPPPLPIPLRRPAAPLPLRPCKRARSSPLLTTLIPTPISPHPEPKRALQRSFDRRSPHHRRPAASLPPELR